ncbi:MAG: transposase [Hydrogenovibrio sp.]
MARLPRFTLPGQPQHVIVRGNNREPIFYSDADYLFYLEKLQQACEKHNCDLHAYVLMTNHVHLMITPNTDNGISNQRGQTRLLFEPKGSDSIAF